MKKRVYRTHVLMSSAAARLIEQAVLSKPDSLVCLATGVTPTRTYSRVADFARKKKGLFQRTRILKLDEWMGMPIGDPGTCESYLQRNVVEPWGVREPNFVGFEPLPKHDLDECTRIQKWLDRNGPIDLCVLGLGMNGHLGFNEPAEYLRAYAHHTELTAATRGHGMISHLKYKPKYGLTLGMAEILQSRKIVLLVSGSHKRQPLHRLLTGDISTDFPASFLRLHLDITILSDESAQRGETARMIRDRTALELYRKFKTQKPQ